MSSWNDYYQNLIECIEERSPQSLNRIAKIVRDTRELEELAPGIIAMACWEAAGFDVITDIALTQGSSRKSSAALKVFSLLAAGAEIDSVSFFIVHEQFLRRLREILRPCEALKLAAKRALFQFVHKAKTEEFLIPLGVSFSQIAFSNHKAAEELVAALSTKWLRFGQGTIEEYRAACITRASDEPFFQNFFEQYGQFLDPMASQIWSEFDLNGILRPDFIVRRSDDSYLIIEIECPSKRLITQHNQLSADVAHAEKQTMQYKEFFIERLREARAIMPNFREPECLVVIGMESHLNKQQASALKANNRARYNLKIVGFDWLAERAQIILENVNQGEVHVKRGIRFSEAAF